MSIPATFISADEADAALALKTAQTYWAAMHVDDPGGALGENEGAAFGRVEMAPANWSDPEDHPTSGRQVIYEEAVAFGTASVGEVYPYIVLWSAETDGDVKYVRRLDEPIEVSTSETLTIPEGDIRFRVGGS